MVSSSTGPSSRPSPIPQISSRRDIAVVVQVKGNRTATMAAVVWVAESPRAHAPEKKGGDHGSGVVRKLAEEDLVVAQPGPPHHTSTATRGAGGRSPMFFLEGARLVGGGGLGTSSLGAGGAWWGVVVLLGCFVPDAPPLQRRNSARRCSALMDFAWDNLSGDSRLLVPCPSPCRG